MLAMPVIASDAPVFSPLPRAYSGSEALVHDTGHHVSSGWQARYRVDAPGYLVSGFRAGGDVLPEGTYRYRCWLALQPGQAGGLLSDAHDVVRLEVWDRSTGEKLMARTFQVADFALDSDNTVRKDIIFSSWKRSGHRFEVRIYWPGLTTVYLRDIELNSVGAVDPERLRTKALGFEAEMGRRYLDRGFVLIQRDDGSWDDLGDAGIWTGLYAASQAWRFRATQDPEAINRMETSLRALHLLHAASPLRGTLVRYVYPDGRVYPVAASKDTYTGFFFAVAQCLPWVRDPDLRAQLLDDIQAVGEHLLSHNLQFIPVEGSRVDLRPYLSDELLHDVENGILASPRHRRNIIWACKAVRLYFWSHGQNPWPEMKPFVAAIEQGDPVRLHQSCWPALYGAVRVVEQLQKDVHRSASPYQALAPRIFPDDGSSPAYDAYAKLDRLLLHLVDHLARRSRPLTGPRDAKVLCSQALHVLHLVKVAAEILPKPNEFQRYYSENLRNGEELLTTALEWDGVDEEFIEAVKGHTHWGIVRTSSAHLAFLAAYDLATLERDRSLRRAYRQLFQRQYDPMQDEFNAMLHTMQPIVGTDAPQQGVGLWSLMLYPEDRRGRGERFWQRHGSAIAARYGGEVIQHAREPLWVSDRPRDPFIWQRTARGLRGDDDHWFYPPIDYLFPYWLARAYHELD